MPSLYDVVSWSIIRSSLKAFEVVTTPSNSYLVYLQI